MDKISAAYAMGWSIELEKGLRSRKPGHPIESINLIGPRLKHWSRESQPTMAVYNFYGLVPWEDRLFADVILLRLADAFVSGDRDVKISVIRVFLSIYRHCKKKDRQEHGVFSDVVEENRLELLRRVKAVLTAESVESRALGLILIGCCAEIAKDVAEMRHIILSALFSCHGLEVKASLFAAGCFSEISNDFGSVFLERLLKLMNSSKTSPALRTAGARTFSKIGSSCLLATKSYKAGAELLRKNLEEGFLATMLISLTKLSLKSSNLISEQVGLLSSFLAQISSSCLQGTVLRCMRNIGEEAAFFLSISAFPFQNLFRMLHEPNLPSVLCCEVLKTLLKMLAYGLPDMLFTDTEEFMKLLRYVEDATQSPIFSVRLLAFQSLISISDKMKGRDELILEVNSDTFPTRVVSAISDQVVLLARLGLSGTSSSEAEKELGSMLKLLLLLVENHPELGYFILDKLELVINNMTNSQNMPSFWMYDSEVHKVVDAGAKQNIHTRVLMFCIYRFLVAFLEILDVSGASTNEIVCKLKQLVSFVCDSNLFDCSTHTFFALLLHSCVNNRRVLSKNQPSSSVQVLSGSNNSVESEALIHGCVKNMLAGGDNWCAYKAGKYAACEGSWYVASFLFEHLKAKVQSDVCCQWLKFLVQFTHSEENVEVLLQQVSCCLPSDHVLAPSAADNCSIHTISSEYIKKLVEAYNDFSSCDKHLKAISLQNGTLCFQRWFMALRMKVILVLVDILKLLNGCLASKDGPDSNRHTRGSDVTNDEPMYQKIKDVVSSMVRISARLASLAEEYDWISTSFVDLDSKSLNIISAHAFSCSLLAFCTEFTTSIVNSSIFGNSTKESGRRQCVIIRTLAARTWHIDFETCMVLMKFLKEYQVHESSLNLQPEIRVSKAGHVSQDILTLCRFSVRRLIGLCNECLGVKKEDIAWQAFKDPMQLRLNIVEAWMHIPFRIPNYLFRVRPTVGALLSSQSAGSRKPNETFVSQGSHLALNLCIQLKNLSSDDYSRFSKIYCILFSKTSFLRTRHNGQPRGEDWAGYQASETDTMKDLNKKLQCLIMKRSREFMNSGDLQSDCQTVETSVCFKTNGRAQGFSTCVLDVSTFPVGSYRIHWLSGGVDHQGAYWSFLPLSPFPEFSVIHSSSES